jgi:hypothetical protein
MRAIVWTVVGLVLVATVGIFIYMRSQDAKVRKAGIPTAAEIKQEADRWVKKADEYAAEAKKLRQTLGAQLTEQKKVTLARLDSTAAALKAEAARLGQAKGEAMFAVKKTLTDLQRTYVDMKHELDKKLSR